MQKQQTGTSSPSLSDVHVFVFCGSDWRDVSLLAHGSLLANGSSDVLLLVFVFTSVSHERHSGNTAGPVEPVYRCCWREWEGIRRSRGRKRRMKMCLVSDEDDRLPVSFNALFSLFLLHSSQCRSSVRAPPRDGCVQFEVRGAVMKGRVQSDAGGVTQLSVTFQDSQTALQQLEVPLQVWGAGPDTQVNHVTPAVIHMYTHGTLKVMYVKSSTTVMFTAECMESVRWCL